MLDELHVENFGVIRSAHLEPGPGLVAVTGETGAGKTLLLGALRLLRGDAARTDLIGPHGAEARVEGRFTVGASESVAMRRLTEGRSRAYLDGAMVPARALAEHLEGVIEIVAQHEHVALGRESVIRRLVDGLLDADGMSAAARYRAAWDRLSSLRAERREVGGDPQALARDLDLARHQAAEIAAAALSPGIDDEVRTRLMRMRHAGEIAESLGRAASSLDDEGGAADALGAAIRAVGAAADLDEALLPLKERLTAQVEGLSDLSRDLIDAVSSIEHDPGALTALEERSAALSALKRKYGPSLDDVIAFGESAAARAETLEHLTGRAESLDKELSDAEHDVAVAGEGLTAARRRAGKTLTAEALVHLRELGFVSPALAIELRDGKPAASGADRIDLVFSSDEALMPGPVSRVASGGELSRLVLAVRVASGSVDAGVVAFDEIDAGVGGVTALALAEKLARLAETRQVLVVTHLPQVAAFADSHFVVERTKSEATVREVTGEERIAALSAMLGGMADSDPGRDHAVELLTHAASSKHR